MDPFYTNLNTLFTKHKNTPNVEIELRLGKINRGTFDSNVGKEKFLKIKNGLDKYKGWEKVKKSNTTCYYFSNNRRMIYDEETDSQIVQFKKRILNENLNISERPLDVRFSVSTETYHKEEISDEAEFARIKNRTSYIRKNLSIDITVVQGQQDDPDAEDDTTYEIELEIIDPKGVSNYKQFISHLMKIDDLFKLLS